MAHGKPPNQVPPRDLSQASSSTTIRKVVNNKLPVRRYRFLLPNSIQNTLETATCGVGPQLLFFFSNEKILLDPLYP